MKQYDHIRKNLKDFQVPIDKEKLLSTGGEHEQALDILDSFFYDRRKWYAANVPKPTGAKSPR